MPGTLHEQARDHITQDAYELADDEGYISYVGASRLEPGYWSADVDVEIEFRPLVDDDGEVVTGYEQATAVAKVGKTVIFDRIYEVGLNPQGYLYPPHYEEV